jgi:lipoprotein-releasing system permease protein
MISYFEKLLAFRYLRSRRREGFISVVAWFSLIGIALGVAALIVVMSVMNGFRKELIGKILGVNGHITIYGPVMGIDEYPSLAEQIRQITSVKNVVPLIEGQVMLDSGRQVAGAQVKGIAREDLASKKIALDTLSEGSFENFSGLDGVLIGSRLAFKLGLQVGDEVRMISPKGSYTPVGMVPRVKTFQVIGIFEIGMFEYDSATVIMPLEGAEVYFQMKDKVSALELMVDNPAQAFKVRDQLIGMLDERFRIYDWQESNREFVNALQVERNAMFIILTLIILVASFNIVSSMIMLVKEKNRDIAILRTMGASRAAILKVFLITGSSIGLIGTCAGVILGLSFALNIENIRQGLQKILGAELFPAEIYYLTRMPADVHSPQVLFVIAIALAFSILATIYPAYKAARTDPAEVLRYG